MDWADKGVPIAMISTPQFFVSQKVAEKHGWNAAQLTGRIMHYKQLPANLSQADLLAVAKVALPGAAAVDHQAAAMYAMKSTRNLAAIESIAKRARYLAMKAAREAITSEDVRLAMRESVLPSDTKLNLALATGKTPRSAATVEANASSCAPRRDSSPLAPRPGCGPSPVLRPVDSLMPPPASARRGVEAALNGD